MYQILRHIPSYKWDDILEETVPRTIITLRLLAKEKSEEAKQMKKIRGR